MTHRNKVVSQRTFGNVTISSDTYDLLEGRNGPVRSYEWEVTEKRGYEPTFYKNANIKVDGQKPEDSFNVVATSTDLGGLIKNELEVTTHNGETVQITKCADKKSLSDAFDATVNSIAFSLGAFVGKED
tara:strand:+ start:49 stop:435 length:387 start_codon:yes stop_codon:yes gene_type:complete